MRASALSSVMASLTDLLPAKILAPWSANLDGNVDAPYAMNPTESNHESNQGGVKAGGCARTSGKKGGRAPDASATLYTQGRRVLSLLAAATASAQAPCWATCVCVHVALMRVRRWRLRRW